VAAAAGGVGGDTNGLTNAKYDSGEFKHLHGSSNSRSSSSSLLPNALAKL